MARLITTGAESGVLGNEDGVLQASATAPAISSAGARTGAFGFRSTALPSYNFSQGFTGATARSYFFSGWVRKSANPAAGKKIGLCEWENGVSQVGIRLDSSGNAKMYVGANDTFSGSVAMADNTWYQFEIEIKVNTGANDDVATFKSSGTTITSTATADVGIAAPTTIVWGQYDYNGTTPSAITVDWDDIAVNDATGAAPDNTFPGAQQIPAAPVVEGTAETAVSTAGTSHAITLPASIASTDMVLITMDIGSTAATVNALTDWTELLDENLANGLKIFQYTGAGVPSNPTFTTSAATRSASIAWRISGADKATTPVIGTTATGTSTGPDPPSVTPAGGPFTFRYIAFAGMAGEEADDDTWGNTVGAGYGPTPPLQKSCGTAGTNLGGLILAAHRGVTNTTENPGAFNVDVSAAWRAQTIAVYAAQIVTTVTAPAASATGSAPVPGLSGGVTAPPATATASAPVPAVNATGGGATVTAPPATATASAPVPGLSGGVSPPPATATGSAPAPVLHAGVTLTAPAATATGSAPAPAVSISVTVTAPPATATGSAPAPVLHAGVTLTAPPATATAAAIIPTSVGGSVNVNAPPATATGSAPAPVLHAGVTLTAPAATATGSAPAPAVGVGIFVAAPSASATASATAPVPHAGATLTSPPATATGSAPVPARSASTTVTPPPAIATGAPAAPVLHAGAVITTPPAIANAGARVPAVGLPPVIIYPPPAIATALGTRPAAVTGVEMGFTHGLPSNDTYPMDEHLPTGEQLGYTP